MNLGNLLKLLPVGLIIICVVSGYLLRFQGMVFYMILFVTIVVSLFSLIKGGKKGG